MPRISYVVTAGAMRSEHPITNHSDPILKFKIYT